MPYHAYLSTLEAITHVKNISKKKPTVKRLLAHTNSLGANNWGESVVEETLYNMRKKGIMKIIKS